MSFRVSCFWVEIPAFEVMKGNNKNLMSKTFFIFSSIPKVKYYGLVYYENPIDNINKFDLQEFTENSFKLQGRGGLVFANY
jgi:hypothetical protein